MAAKSKKADIKHGDTLDEIVSALTTKGEARFLHLGKFKVMPKKGGLRYDFKKKKMVPYASYKTVIFTPAEGLHDLINPGNPRRKKRGR